MQRTHGFRRYLVRSGADLSQAKGEGSRDDLLGWRGHEPPGLQFWRDLARFHQGLQMKGGERDVLLKARLPNQRDRGGHERRGGLLDLDVQVSAAPVSNENLSQRGDPEGLGAMLGKWATEPPAGIQAFDLGQRAARDGPVPIGGAIQRVVMNNHHLPVRGEVHIKLDVARPHLQGEVEGRQRVLGPVAGTAAVGEREGSRVVEEGESVAHRGRTYPDPVSERAVAVQDAPGRDLMAVCLGIAATISPGFMLGSLYVEMGPDLGYGEATSGALVAAFFGASAVLSAPVWL